MEICGAVDPYAKTLKAAEIDRQCTRFDLTTHRNGAQCTVGTNAVHCRDTRMLRLEIAWWRSSCGLPELVLCIAQKAHLEFISVERRRIDCVFSRFSLPAAVAAVGSRCRWKSTLFMPQEVV
ncbi:hypothetical protein GCM10010207_68070 [Streptomyces atratus]|nr:hypothetical protein GCM10010207_68070 [Streptomyces atratus]